MKAFLLQNFKKKNRATRNWKKKQKRELSERQWTQQKQIQKDRVRSG